MERSLEYLDSPAALESLARDFYWPKWDSPWWHMCLLHEIGETRRIPDRAMERLVEALISAGPEEHCVCSLGNIYQVLAGWGVEVDREMPWIRPWLLERQMADGGLSCDESAYQVQGECPSSMVATIAPFEAILHHTGRPWTAEERRFLERGAKFLAGRELRLGSDSRHNAAEREQAGLWTELSFPRFYFYDVLRGLDALSAWWSRCPDGPECSREALNTLESLPRPLVAHRRSYTSSPTRWPLAGGEWGRLPQATTFPLLDEVSQPGQPSRYLEAQWERVQDRLRETSAWKA